MPIGLFPSTCGSVVQDTHRLDQFASLLKAGGTPCRVVPNIQVFRWEKVVWNAAWNSLTALTMMDTHAWLSSSPTAISVTRRVMLEVIQVARALKVLIPYSLVDDFLTRIQKLPPIRTSMMTDLENGKHMEVEMILGYTVQMGLKLGLNIPTIEIVYAILTATNSRLVT